MKYPDDFDDEGVCKGCGGVIEAHREDYRCDTWPNREQWALIVGLALGEKRE